MYFTPQGVGNLAWAYAKLDFYDPARGCTNTCTSTYFILYPPPLSNDRLPGRTALLWSDPYSDRDFGGC